MRKKPYYASLNEPGRDRFLTRVRPFIETKTFHDHFTEFWAVGSPNFERMQAGTCRTMIPSLRKRYCSLILTIS